MFLGRIFRDAIRGFRPRDDAPRMAPSPGDRDDAVERRLTAATR
jgi:hypothetical protein